MDQSTVTPTTVVTGVASIASSVIVQSAQEDASASIALASIGGGSGVGGGGGGSIVSIGGISSAGSISGVSAAGATGPSISDIQRSISAAPSATPSPVLSPPGKIFGRNSNGTMVATSAPNNEAELQLYRVLQRASLLSYYDTLLEMGGDDVQQLCDAGEEEFLEIMALVGMASKPLHVRRLQKALHEWANNPLAFQTPLQPSVEPTQLMYSPEPSTSSRSKYLVGSGFTPTPLIGTAAHPPVTGLSSGLPTLTTPTGIGSHVTSSSPQLTPTLTEAQVQRLSLASERLARELPQREPRAHSSKKRTSREIEQVMTMSENDPRRMDEIRKYAAIYGRFDCKRRAEKPLTLHEVCINEAAAQICRFVPALLTRRDELFPLARKIVKDCGFGHSASIARFGLIQQQPSRDDSDPAAMAKRTRLSSDSTPTGEYSKDIIEESRNNLFAIYQKLGRSFDLSDIAKFSHSRSEDYDDNDNDSRFSFSNSSSPSLQLNGSEMDVMNMSREHTNGRDDSSLRSPPPSLLSISQCGSDGAPNSPLGVQVIAASGGHIIAVANPALAMSSALNETLSIKRETISPDI